MAMAGEDNASFELSGSVLKSKSMFDFKQKRIAFVCGENT
jgi:hypothetical protein